MSIAEALRARLALEDELKLELGNAPVSKPHRKLGKVADEWLAEITSRRREEDPTQPHLTGASRLRYEGSVRDFVKPFFGEFIAECIRADDVRGWRQHLLEHGYKRVTVTPGVKRDRFGEDVPPLLPEVYEALKEHWATFNEVQQASGLMFPDTDGRHHSKSVLRKCFADALRRAGISRRFTPHGCRRTGAKRYGRTEGTRMAMEIAGHKSLAMHHHYTPVDASEKQLAAKKTFGHLRVLSGGGR